MSRFTWNNALSYDSSQARLELYYHSARGLEKEKLYEKMSRACAENMVDAFVLAFFIRDSRGGKGERELGRQALSWLLAHRPEQFRRIIPLLAEYGRWDDLLAFFPKVFNVAELKVPDEKAVEEVQKDIVRLMARQLKEDVKKMKAGEPVSLCAKWAPTEKDALDRRCGTFATLALALHMHPAQVRKEVLTPLRQYLKIVESYMCSGQWNRINFSRVPSQAMKKLKKAFQRHAPKEFEAWIAKLRKGEVKVNFDQLHPHELIREMIKKGIDPVAEVQWHGLVEKAKAKGMLRDTVVVSDVSSSMDSPNGLPMSVSIALGLLISEVVEGPFHNFVVTFADEPRLIRLEGDLKKRLETIRGMPWGGNTNLQRTFEVVLNEARAAGCTDQNMPKNIIIVSDMQFDMACPNNDKSNMEAIEKMYAEYGFTRPNIIFWNVNGQITDFPVQEGKYGTALLSGFSVDLLDAFLFEEKISPLIVLEKVLHKPRYQAVRQALA